jgi:4-amino-4-deoxy-L-arabinose transferase-like glycosyltransferase
MTFPRWLWTKPFLLVFGLATAVHWLVIGASFWQENYAEGTADEARYVFYGESIRAGRGMHAPGYEDKPTAYVMPALPLLFAAVGTESLVRLRFAQVILSALVAILTFYLADRLLPKTDTGLRPSTFGEGLGVRLNARWLAVIFLLANLAWTLQPLYLLTEPLFSLFLLLGVGAIALQPADWRYLAGAGLALGLAWLTRGALFGVLPLIFLYLWWRAGFARMFLVGLVMGLTILPWVIRNFQAFDAFVPTSTQSGQVIAGAYNDNVYANPWGEGWVNPDELYRDQISPDLFNDELAYSDYLTEQGMAWIKENPDKLPRLMISHVFHYLRPYPKLTRNTVELIYEVATWGLGIILLSYGMWCGWKNREEWLLVFGLVILGGFLTGLIFYATPRFRIPYAPYFALIEAYAAWHLWLKLKAVRCPLQ